jgi:hypothetical protein
MTREDLPMSQVICKWISGHCSDWSTPECGDTTRRMLNATSTENERGVADGGGVDLIRP